MPFWIKERINPQLGTYYVACGKMKVKDAKAAEDALYGSNEMHRFDSEEEYLAALAKLEASGERIR